MELFSALVVAEQVKRSKRKGCLSGFGSWLRAVPYSVLTPLAEHPSAGVAREIFFLTVSLRIVKTCESERKSPAPCRDARDFLRESLLAALAAQNSRADPCHANEERYAAGFGNSGGAQELHDVMAGGVHNEEIAAAVEGNADGDAQLPVIASQTIANVLDEAAAGVELYDAVVVSVCDKDVAVAVEGHASGKIQLPVVAASTAANVLDEAAAGVKFYDAVVALVCDKDVAVAVKGNALWIKQLSVITAYGCRRSFGRSRRWR